MPTTTNYGWTTPADTDLVKDGAAAIRTLGSSIDTTVFNNANAAIAKTIVDAKGDIIAATAADTVSRLAVGANNTVLTADSSTATGLKWAAAASSSASFSLLNAGGTSLSGSSTVTISGISGQNTLMILIADASHSSGNSKNYIQLNSDTTAANYEKYGLGLDNNTTYNQNMFYGLGGSVVGEPWIELGEGSAAGNIDGYCLIQGCNTTNPKVFQSIGAPNNADAKRYLVGGLYLGNSTISSVSFVSSSSNFDAGTIFVYGSAV